MAGSGHPQAPAIWQFALKANALSACGSPDRHVAAAALISAAAAGCKRGRAMESALPAPEALAPGGVRSPASGRGHSRGGPRRSDRMLAHLAADLGAPASVGPSQRHERKPFGCAIAADRVLEAARRQAAPASCAAPTILPSSRAISTGSRPPSARRARHRIRSITAASATRPFRRRRQAVRRAARCAPRRARAARTADHERFLTRGASGSRAGRRDRDVVGAQAARPSPATPPARRHPRARRWRRPDRRAIQSAACHAGPSRRSASTQRFEVVRRGDSTSSVLAASPDARRPVAPRAAPGA